MIRENEVMYEGSFANRSARLEVLALPSTPSFNSLSKRTASPARDFPMLDGPSKKKLFPASSGVTFPGSRIVKCPMPGRTRFFSIDVDVADAEMTKILECSRALWPEAAHRLMTMSKVLPVYLLRTYRS